MSNKVVIFDFDGTFADSFNTVISILNSLSTTFKYSKVEDPEEIEKFKGLGALEILKHFNISKIKMFFILRRLKKELQDEIPNIKTFDGIKDLLDQLKERDFRIDIISSNSTRNIKQFLKNNNINVFDNVIGDVSPFGKTKRLKQISKKFKDSDIFYVADELRDIDAARKAGVRVVSVSWGYNTKSSLERSNPGHVANIPEDVLKLIEKN